MLHCGSQLITFTALSLSCCFSFLRGSTLLWLWWHDQKEKLLSIHMVQLMMNGENRKGKDWRWRAYPVAYFSQLNEKTFSSILQTGKIFPPWFNSAWTNMRHHVGIVNELCTDVEQQQSGMQACTDSFTCTVHLVHGSCNVCVHACRLYTYMHTWHGWSQTHKNRHWVNLVIPISHIVWFDFFCKQGKTNTTSSHVL